MDITSYILGKKAGGGGGSNYQSKSIEITENGTTNVTADSGYDALKNVNVTVSGILDTSDANAVASDMATGKTAYVDGTKITGNVPVGSSSVATNYASNNVGTYLDDLKVDTEQGSQNQMFRTGDKISVYAPLSDVAPVIGASAGKIKKNEVICGVTGTYEGGETVEPEENDVNFYNYDGTRLYAYTKQEFLALNEFPANPVNEGMTSQGWNWDYQKAVNYVTEYGILDVGESCVTSDGKTRIYIHLPVDNLQPVVGLIINGTITIDWGDNTTPSSVTNNNNNVKNTSHTYENAGDYVVTISLVGSSSKIALSGSLNYGGTLFYGNGDRDMFYRNCVQKIELGTIVNYGTNCLGQFGSLETVNIPYMSTAKMGSIAFGGDYKLNRVILPKNHTKFSSTGYITQYSTSCVFSSEFSEFGANHFSVGNNRIIIPENTFTTYGGQGFYGDNLGGIIIPKTLQVFGHGFWGRALTYIDCSHFTQVPALISAEYMNSTSLNSSCKIIVPDSLYNDWIVADNWSTIASKIISKSGWDNL